MAHDIPMKEIALQAGVGLATVDRVLHRRGGVRLQTMQRIEQAIEELRRQEAQPRPGRRRLLLDLVMDAPERFSTAVAQAIETEIKELPEAAARVRLHLTETATGGEITATLGRIARRGSHGVILKAPALVQIEEAVGVLVGMRIPVVTLVTDLPGAKRVAYVGLDNRAAGAAAAYLVGQWMGGRKANVLVSLSSHRFQGEEQREIGFAETLGQVAPRLGIVRVDESRGLDRAMRRLAGAALEQDGSIEAVYSIGGGNRALCEAFQAAGRVCRVFIGHDLDEGNRLLLQEGRISAVLNHDLRNDMRLACRAIMQAQGLVRRSEAPALSAVGIVTPFNLPLA